HGGIAEPGLYPAKPGSAILAGLPIPTFYGGIGKPGLHPLFLSTPISYFVIKLYRSSFTEGLPIPGCILRSRARQSLQPYRSLRSMEGSVSPATIHFSFLHRFQIL